MLYPKTEKEIQDINQKATDSLIELSHDVMFFCPFCLVLGYKKPLIKKIKNVFCCTSCLSELTMTLKGLPSVLSELTTTEWLDELDANRK